MILYNTFWSLFSGQSTYAYGWELPGLYSLISGIPAAGNVVCTTFARSSDVTRASVKLFTARPHCSQCRALY